jgi:hypothetical protein
MSLPLLSTVAEAVAWFVKEDDKLRYPTGAQAFATYTYTGWGWGLRKILSLNLNVTPNRRSLR